MSAFLNGVSAVVVVLMLMLLGFFMGKLGWMGPGEKRFLGKYLINFFVPMNCLTGILNNLDREMLARMGWMLLCAYVSIALNFLLGAGFAALLRLPKNRWGVFVAMAGLSNTIFIGLPLSTQLFGDACLPYLMTYYLASTTFTQTAAVLLVEASGTGSVTPHSPAYFALELLKKPPVIGIICSVLLLALDLRPPAFLMSFARYVSNSGSAMALIYCGFILYEMGLKNMRLERGLPTVVLCRLVLAPLLCALMCRLFGVEGFIRNVFVVESALPVVSQVPVMAGTYGADDHYAATGAALTTLGCFLTIPVLMMLLG